MPWSTLSRMRGAASSTESSMPTMSGVAAKASRTRLATRIRPASSGPYTSATMGESTGGPGGTSTTFTLAPQRCAIASSPGRTDCAMSWLLRWRASLGCRLTCRSPVSEALRR